MTRQSTISRLVGTVTLLAVALTGTLVTAQDALRLTRNVPGDSKPIVLYADAAATWTEHGQRIILLSGKVLIEQNLLNVRCTEAVVWVDEDAYKKTRIMHAQLYAEGAVTVENGSKTEHSAKALIDLNTRGELKLKAQGSKVVQKAQVEDALYLRALAEKTGPVPVDAKNTTAKDQPKGPPTGKTAPPSIQRTGFQDPNPAPPLNPQAIPAPVPPQPTTPAPPLPSAVAPGAGLLPLPPGPNGVPPAPGLGPASGLPGSSPGPAMQPPGAPFGPPGIMRAPPGPSGPTLLPVPPGTVPLPARPGQGPGSAAAVPRAPVNGPPRIVTIAPRTSKPFEWQSFPLSTGEKAIVATGGVILMVRNLQNMEVIDIEADRLVFWSQGDTENLFSNMRSTKGQATRELEFYLSGNVEMRQQTRPTDNRILRADEVYYDVGRNVAVSVSANLEITRVGIPEPIHLKADEILQLSPTLYEAVRAEVFASRLPSDPGLKVYMAQATLEEQKRVQKPALFGYRRAPHNKPPNTLVATNVPGDLPTASGDLSAPRAGTPGGAPGGPPGGNEPDRYFRGTNAFFELESVPFFYVPFLQGNVERPLGPLVDGNLGYNKIFGFQAGATFDVYDLFGLERIAGTNWRTDVDYLSLRGPGWGSKFNDSGKDFFGIPSYYQTDIRAWGIYDRGEDIIGGTRNDQDHPLWRGRFFARENWWGLPDGFTVQAQVDAQSDQNLLEQYYKNEFDSEMQQQTFVYVKQQQENWAWTGLGNVRTREWMTETQWLPRFDGYLIGQSFFDRFTYSAHASAGYAQLRPTDESPPPTEPTQVSISTGRVDLNQELAMPFYVGPVRVVPYGIADLTYYSQDLAGDDRGRVYVAGGVRASMPLTRVYPDISSELWNLNGINHKITLSTNYFIAHSDTPYNELPQLDPIEDEISDHSRRDIVPIEQQFNQQYGFMLATSPLYLPQTFAIRQLVGTAVDTLDTVEELQMDIRQRWQTKRGYPGMQHIVDWMTLDLQATYFPHPTRDDFGSNFAFLKYDWVLNIGDRTTVVSDGWVDPETGGPRVFSVGSYLNRTDRTNFFIGYQDIYPLNVRAVSASVTYILSPKYAVTGSTVYDFGNGQALSNSLVLTRMGSDLQVSVGITYNVLTNNFGATFMIIPNLIANRAGTLGGMAANMMPFSR